MMSHKEIRDKVIKRKDDEKRIRINKRRMR